MLMILFPLPSGSHFRGKFAGFCCRRVVFFAVIPGRGGGRVRDPVEAAVPGEVGSHHPLVRPHTIPGVSNNTGALRRSGGRPHPMAARTTLRLSWSGEGGTVQDGRRGLIALCGMQGPAFLERASISCAMVLRYWLCPLRRSTNRRLAKERGFALDPKELLYPMVRG